MRFADGHASHRKSRHDRRNIGHRIGHRKHGGSALFVNLFNSFRFILGITLAHGNDPQHKIATA